MQTYNKVWDKISNIMLKGFDSEPVYTEKYLKNKIKSYDGKMKTNFHDKGVLKEGPHCVCSSVPLIDSFFKIGKNFYPQVYLEECKNVWKDDQGYQWWKSSLKLFIMRVSFIIADWMAANLKIFIVLKWFEVI